jgi:hypothetical protein
VRRATREPDAGGQRVADGVGAAEGRQQGRVEVDDAAGKRLAQRGAKDAHEARQHDEAALLLLECALQLGVVLGASALARQDEGRNAARAGRGQNRRLVLVADDEADAGRHDAGLDGLRKGDQIRPLAACQHRDVERPTAGRCQWRKLL